MAAIANKLEKYGSVEVGELARELHVTEKTIRHDLDRMEKKGLLKRVHGGAVSISRQPEDAYASRSRIIGLKAKEEIAKAAFTYYQHVAGEDQVVFIDAGTTNFEFARYLRNMPLTLITNDLMIVSKLSSLEGHLHVTGGRLANNVNRYLVGADAIEMISRHAFSMCFIGASSISAQNGFMTHTDEDAQVKRAVLARSGERICLADHTKFNRSSFVKFADMGQMDVLITDAIDLPTRREFSEAGLHVIAADEEIQR